ncbi:hypothetical protein DPMN_094905 [Dreissena polymorpha]|uniref:Uncharacterized protein n=1 Tax=Dreissena polymorpha TaxID=45954 RepID=A0A9D4L5X1_DREPO|nr:hypothetical protein DPMN_094905 [Dreissena polymorpha]
MSFIFDQSTITQPTPSSPTDFPVSTISGRIPVLNCANKARSFLKIGLRVGDKDYIIGV